MATYAINQEFNGIEITFAEKPARDVLDAIKAAGYRWHNAKKLWYAKNTEKRLEIARKIADGETVAADTEKPRKAANSKPQTKENRFGVKVGDFFSASWGYDQTNNDYFQVVALVGETSVRVREVYPEIIDETAYSHGMAADRVYKLDRSKILPPAPRSVFIEDQERGDLKRLKSYRQDGTHPQFKLASFCDAHYCYGETEKAYESWYA